MPGRLREQGRGERRLAARGGGLPRPVADTRPEPLAATRLSFIPGIPALTRADLYELKDALLLGLLAEGLLNSCSRGM